MGSKVGLLTDGSLVSPPSPFTLLLLLQLLCLNFLHCVFQMVPLCPTPSTALFCPFSSVPVWQHRVQLTVCPPKARYDQGFQQNMGFQSVPHISTPHGIAVALYELPDLSVPIVLTIVLTELSSYWRLALTLRLTYHLNCVIMAHPINKMLKYKNTK